MATVWGTFVYTKDADGAEVYCGQFENDASAQAWLKTQEDPKKFEVSSVRPRDRKATP